MAHHRSGWRQWILAAVCLVAAPLVCRAEETVRLDHVVVPYTGVSEEYAQAIGRTVAAARAVAVEQFGFDMPETITVTVTADPKGETRLFTDGQDHFSLTVRSQQQLAQPSSSGIFHLYGMCHEVGHLAMYRPIRDHSWMTTAAAEGWAHYLGSRIVDEVYRREGEDLWPDRYDYRADGMKRLDAALASSSPSDVDKGAGVWKDLVSIVGDKGVAPLFAAWGKAQPDSADPGKVLGEVLPGDAGDKRLSQWWDGAQGTLVFKRPKSDFLAKTSKPAQLSGKSHELSHDDGRPAGKKSIAGGGHAVRFEGPGGPCYVTSVRIYGSRYGQSRPPDEDFRVWICDADFQTIAEYKYPYSYFGYGRPGWVKLKVKPTLVPEEFIVCVGFNPTATKGVFMTYDREADGDSMVGLPGKRGDSFRSGDWLIRASVDRPKDADQAAESDTTEDGSPKAIVRPNELSGKSQELSHDDGRSAGKKSIAGGGHAVRFEVPGDRFYVKSVRINGSRYGHPRPPNEDFRVWICDADFRTIAEYKYPYSYFGYGKPGWVKVRLKPTLVPEEFIVCVGFNPTATKGIFMNYDAEGSGDSLVGLPGEPGDPFPNGDWLIRATVDQLKGAEAGPSDREGADREQAAAPTGSSRMWTDATGSFKVEAEFLGIEGDKVRLRKSSGRVITVPLGKLSNADQQLAREAAGRRSR